jgi:hypothetical protein
MSQSHEAHSGYTGRSAETNSSVRIGIRNGHASGVRWRAPSEGGAPAPTVTEMSLRESSYGVR